jgi:hypothetical protein
MCGPYYHTEQYAIGRRVEQQQQRAGHGFGRDGNGGISGYADDYLYIGGWLLRDYPGYGQSIAISYIGFTGSMHRFNDYAGRFRRRYMEQWYPGSSIHRLNYRRCHRSQYNIKHCHHYLYLADRLYNGHYSNS